MSEPFWISEEIATTIHADQIAQHQAQKFIYGLKLKPVETG